MADDWMEDDGWLTDAEKRRQPDPNRGQILPFKKTEDGVELAWPQFMVDAYNAVTLPKDTLQGYNPTVSDTTNFALGVGGGGVTTSAITKPEADLGMFLGKRAKNADTKKLAQAMEMAGQGVPREEIWAQTGWWQKPDGEWAWEISDDAFKINEDVLDALWSPEPEARPAYVGSDEHWRPEAEVFSQEPGQVFEHPELFNNYSSSSVPEATIEEIADMSSEEWTRYINARRSTEGLPLNSVKISSGSHINTGGLYHPYNQSIDVRGTNESTINRVAIHELQHAVQTAENWKGRGTNPEWTSSVENIFKQTAPIEAVEFMSIENRLKSVRHGKEHTTELLNNLKLQHEEAIKSRGKFSKFFPDKKLEENIKWIEDKTKELEDELDFYVRREKELSSTSENLLKNPKLKAYNDKLKEFQDKFGEDPMAIYHANEGEMLSNITASRLKMTDEERKAIPPWEHFGTDVNYGAFTTPIPEEKRAWTDKDLEKFIRDWVASPRGNLEDFNRELKEAMNGKR